MLTNNAVLEPDYLMRAYARLNIQFVKGKGIWLFDTKGQRYLDAISGIGVTILGHTHPVITEAIQQQIKSVLHISNLYYHPTQLALAKKLCDLTGLSEVFFCNSGAEANEAALKIARLYGQQKGIANPHIVVMHNSFHGRTLATLSASGNPKIQQGFQPLLPGFIHIPFNNLDALYALRTRQDIVAVLLEPIQGAAGVIVPDDNYLLAINDVCREQNWLLVLDEIQTGLGRTGRLFAHQLSNIQPDVMTLAKGLANGLPIGCCLISEKLMNIISPGRHGSTFGGNPVACAAALATLTVLETHQLWKKAEILGKILMAKLHSMSKNYTEILHIQGKGLMIGIEINQPCQELMDIALQHGLLINITNQNIIRLLPALIIDESDLEKIVSRLDKSLKFFFNNT